MIEDNQGYPALSIEDVSFRYQGAKPLFANLNLKVKVGEFVSLVGMSGSGKTTLLKLAGSLIQPAQGLIKSNGVVRTVFQQSNLYPWFSVLKNVELGDLTGTARNVVRSRSHHLLSDLGLENKAHCPVSNLSGGEQQRVAIARAFVANPSLVLMDEPFSALDEIRRRSAQNFLMKFRADKNAGILFVTHNIEEAILLGNRVIVINSLGQLIEYEVPFSFPRLPECIFDTEFVELRRAITSNFSVLDAPGPPLQLIK